MADLPMLHDIDADYSPQYVKLARILRDKIKSGQDQAAVVGANIRILRQQHGWNQAKVGELMGWPSNSTVCAAEGRRDGRQRGFTTLEVERRAAIFGVSPSQLTARCANCGGHPPAGFACLTGAARPQT